MDACKKKIDVGSPLAVHGVIVKMFSRRYFIPVSGRPSGTAGNGTGADHRRKAALPREKIGSQGTDAPLSAGQALRCGSRSRIPTYACGARVVGRGRSQ
jgi:hypothetical protein